MRRAFVVTMGFFKPSSGDTLMSYMGKHFTDEHTVDSVSDQWDGYEDADKRQINSYDDAAFPFLGYSFIKTAGIESLKAILVKNLYKVYTKVVNKLFETLGKYLAKA